MTAKVKTPDVELFGGDSVDDLLTAIDGKCDQIDVILDIVYPYFTHAVAGERELMALQYDFTKIRTLLEMSSDALNGIREQVDRWNKITREIQRKQEQEKKEGATSCHADA